MKTRIAFQGAPGAYSELAARQYFGDAPPLLACHDFDAVFAVVSGGKATHAVLPLENSLTGSIHRNYDLLINHDLWITGEVKLRISHNLLGLPGSTLKGLTRIYSHPQALGQCDGFLRTLRGTEAIPYFDTAGSAAFVAAGTDRATGAIASAEAARRYGLKVLRKSIEDNPHNYTRFMVLTRRSEKLISTPVRAGSKTSVVFALKNIPGALHKSLSIFAIRDIDLIKIESRPIHGKPWQYMFYLDFAGWHGDEAASRALAHLGEITVYQKLLGSYRGAEDAGRKRAST